MHSDSARKQDLEAIGTNFRRIRLPWERREKLQVGLGCCYHGHAWIFIIILQGADKTFEKQVGAQDRALACFYLIHRCPRRPRSLFPATPPSSLTHSTPWRRRRSVRSASPPYEKHQGFATIASFSALCLVVVDNNSSHPIETYSLNSFCCGLVGKSDLQLFGSIFSCAHTQTCTRPREREANKWIKKCLNCFKVSANYG